MDQRTLITAEAEAAAMLQAEEDAEFPVFLSGWTNDTTAACPVGMRLLLARSNGDANRWHMAEARGFQWARDACVSTIYGISKCAQQQVIASTVNWIGERKMRND